MFMNQGIFIEEQSEYYKVCGWEEQEKQVSNLIKNHIKKKDGHCSDDRVKKIMNIVHMMLNKGFIEVA